MLFSYLFLSPIFHLAGKQGNATSARVIKKGKSEAIRPVYQEYSCNQRTAYQRGRRTLLSHVHALHTKDSFQWKGDNTKGYLTPEPLDQT